MQRRSFLKCAAAILSAGALSLAAGCTTQDAPSSGQADNRLSIADLPAASPDPDSPFGVDENINMTTIDDYLHIEGAAYRDLRLLEDPADYASIGGSSLLDFTLEGFLITPLPLIANLPELPVDGAYEGEALFDVCWEDDATVVSVTPRYEQSEQILEDLFPKDAPLFLMCGGGGYAGMMRSLLIFLGWDESQVYNIGAAWEYDGYHSIQLMVPRDDGTIERFLWRAEMPLIVLEDYQPLA